MVNRQFSNTLEFPEVKPPSTLEVLIVEDNHVLQCIAKKMFMNAGIEEKNITIAENGKVAVDIVSQRIRAFSLIYMDELMPVMKGPEATTKIRAHEQRNDSFSVIFTCSATYDCIFPGANTRLEKPIIFAGVKKIVDAVTKRPEQFWKSFGDPQEIQLENLTIDVKPMMLSRKRKNPVDKAGTEEKTLIDVESFML